MARASTTTWLSLDRWAQIIGTDPLHFNGIYTSLRPIRSGCDDLWMQYDWQNTQKVSRESLAEAIRDAEDMVANYVGYNLLPDWRTDERDITERPAMRELFDTGINVRGYRKSVRADRGHIISGGQKARTVIEAGSAITRSDADGDGYNELCTVSVSTSITDTNEIRAFFPGKSGADEWEIRPLESVTANGTTATLTFKIWQVVDPDLWEALDASGIDGDTAGNFETTVDVYRVYNDISQMVQFLWEPFPRCSCGGSTTCTVCQFSTQYGCLHTRDARLGRFAYSPATYDSDTGSYTETDYINTRGPDRVRLWYYSGWQNKSLDRPHVQLDPYWEKVVSRLAIALMDRELCVCDNVLEFYKHWRENVSEANVNRTFNVTFSDLGNEFGPTRGGIYAWKRANAPGRRLPS